MIFFFIEGLSGSIDELFPPSRSQGDFIPAEAQVVSTQETVDLSADSSEDDEQQSAPNEAKGSDELVNSSPDVDPLAFRAPAESERPQILTPLGNTAILSEIPLRLVIPDIELDAPIIPVEPEVINVWGMDFQQWASPDEYAAGWHDSSAKLGEAGNMVLNGHHNISGEVFRRLIELDQEDVIGIYSDQHLFMYKITNKMILPETYESLEVRLSNAQWILPSEDERLTLITCWPYESNTHRLVIVAKPTSVEELPEIDQELLPLEFDEGQK